MLRKLGLVVAMLSVISGAGAATEPKPADILSRYKSATGRSIWDRVRACHLTVLPRPSHVDKIFKDSASADLKAGDLAIELWVRLPQPHASEVALLWRARGGALFSQSGWANKLQQASTIPELHC